MRELCEKAKQGDAKAFADLYAQYAQKLYATAFYLLGRKEDAEDIVMDTVADAFAQIRSLRNADAFGGWIFRILMNKLKRKRKEYALACEEELFDTLPAEAGEPSAEHAALRQAVAQLPQQDREIVLLGVLGGYESAEIAQILGMNANTVRSRRMRTLAKLREMLTEGEMTLAAK